MKSNLTLITLVLLTFLAKAGPFKNTKCIPYDELWMEIASNTVSSNYGYREAYTQSLYTSTAFADVFVKKSCQHNNIKKPFVFVEGFSFDKSYITEQEKTSKSYFTQNETISHYAIIDSIINDPNFNETLYLGYSTFNWGTFCTGIDAEGLAAGNPLRVEKLPDLLNKLYDASFDIVYVDFRQGTQYIQNNGMALVKVLEALEDSLQASGSTEKITVCGASMGGLISRYALNYIHQHGNPHLVDKFISFDSPQRGANIPFSLQCLLSTLNQIGNNTIREKYDGVTSPAASQMLLTSCLASNLNSPFVYTEPQASLERFELLMNPYFQWNFSAKKISIINGSRLGDYQNNPSFSSGGHGLDVDGFVDLEMYPVGEYSNSYEKILDLDVGNFTCGNISLPMLGLPGILLGKQVKVRNTLNAEKCAGSYRNDYPSLVNSLEDLGHFVLMLNSTNSGLYTNLICNLFENPPEAPFARNCFIPSLSAASIKTFDQLMKNAYPYYSQLIFQGNEKLEDPTHQITDFDVVYAPDHNQTHVEITDENIDWLLTEVIGPNYLLFQNENIDPGIHWGRKEIRAGKNVGKPNTAIGDAVVLPNTFVTFRAGEKISLEPGFVCNAGQGGVAGTFIAEIYQAPFCPKSLPSNNLNRPELAGHPYGLSQNSETSPQIFASLAKTEAGTFRQEEKLKIPVFQVYPNPSDGAITIDQESEAYHLLEIYNAIGIRVKVIELRKARENIRIDELASGLYTITCRQKPEFTYRLLKR